MMFLESLYSSLHLYSYAETICKGLIIMISNAFLGLYVKSIPTFSLENAD